ncbi:MAG: DUF4271 domain-containing protein [Chitinophagaceae bacterium]|nr:DUF4271 domain-containing protein [Chitinophagaceae bacterium]
MKRYIYFLLGYLFIIGVVSGQTPADTISVQPVGDSIRQKDTTGTIDTLVQQQNEVAMLRKIVYDSLLMNSVQVFSFPSGNWEIIKQRFSYKGKTQLLQDAPPAQVRKVQGKELLFYLLVLLFIVFAILRRAFPKYFSDLFRLFFKTTIKQRQIREQLMQTPLPSLLLNGFFVVSGGLYIAFLLQHYSIDPLGNFWLMFMYCCAGMSVAYFIKFAGLKICGWLFGIEEAADSYIFIVFIVNKMIGILLLPFLLILAFSAGAAYAVGLTLSWFLLGGLILYRMVLTYAAVRNQVKVNPFHFFLYIFAFEIAPLLLVYKALMLFFNQTT